MKCIVAYKVTLHKLLKFIDVSFKVIQKMPLVFMKTLYSMTNLFTVLLFHLHLQTFAFFFVFKQSCELYKKYLMAPINPRKSAHVPQRSTGEQWIIKRVKRRLNFRTAHCARMLVLPSTATSLIIATILRLLKMCNEFLVIKLPKEKNTSFNQVINFLWLTLSQVARVYRNSKNNMTRKQLSIDLLWKKFSFPWKTI